MPDEKGNLYLFEAIALRNEYDRHVKLIEELLEESGSKKERLFRSSDEEEKEPASDFDPNEMRQRLKKLQTKRVKLNQAIQVANFEYKVDHDGEAISLAEALEIRKNLLADIEALSQRVVSSAYKRVIHKEERDIIREPRQPFKEGYGDFQELLSKLRNLVTAIHVVNHVSTVKFKDEK